MARSLQEPQCDISVHVALSKLFLDGVFTSLAVGHVETEVRPLVCSSCGATVGDGDSVTHTKVHGLHDALPLQFTSRPDGHGGHVTTGANKLLAIIMALLHVLEASPNGQTELLWDLKSSKILGCKHRKVSLTLASKAHIGTKTHFLFTLFFSCLFYRSYVVSFLKFDSWCILLIIHLNAWMGGKKYQD